MLTPSFSVSQTPRLVSIVIRAPYVKAAETEIFVDGPDFRFWSKPYFLRLVFPGRLIDEGDDVAKARYDFDEGKFFVHLVKESAGEHFEGLELTSNLLVNTRCKPTLSKVEPLIEPVDGDGVELGPDDAALSDDEDVEEDWSWEQKLPSDDDDADNPSLTPPSTYGFANKASGLFAVKLAEERGEVTDLADPDATPQQSRTRLKWLQENEGFSTDHYLADLYEDEEIKPLIEADNKWSVYDSSLSAFTEEEVARLKNMRRREFILSPRDRRTALLSVLDVVLAVSYDVRTTCGDPTVESGWTVNKLSGTLSWFVEFPSVSAVLSSFFRRSLIFPLYRHFRLSLACAKDAVDILRRGRVSIVKLLLGVYDRFVVAEPRYILNDLYVVDLIHFIQTVKASRFSSLADKLENGILQMSKSVVGLELVELEAAAEIVKNDDDEDTSDSDNSEDNDPSQESDDADDNDYHESSSSTSEFSDKAKLRKTLVRIDRIDDSDDDSSDQDLENISERLSSIIV